MSKLKFVFALVVALTGAVVVADAEETTTVYVQGTIPLDKGKPSMSAGASYEQTKGNTTTKVDVNTDGKNVNLTGSASQRH
jgi:uncharacterized cupredoxin-like copper-binding protein